MIDRFLELLPLNSYEKAVVRRLSAVESATATQLVKTAGVPQGRIYSVLNGLITKGIVVLIPTKPKQYRIPDVRAALHEYLEHAKQELEQHQQELKELSLHQRTSAHNAPSVELFTGREEHLDVLARMRAEARKEILQSAPLFIGSNKSNIATLRAIGRGVKVRVIIKEVNAANAKPVLDALRAGAQVRRSSSEDLLSLIIKDGDEVLLGVQDHKRNEERLTLLTRNKPLAAALRSQFDLEWRRAVAVTEKECRNYRS
jgi:sugar-specific transcriptional regulator TrmB